MSDLIPGTSFVNGQTVTANDLNEIVGSASLNTKVVSSSHLKDDLFTSMDELSASDLKTEDLLIVWSPSQEKFLKIRKEEFTSDNDQATSLSNDGLGITSQGALYQQKDIINLIGLDTDINGDVNASNAIVLRSADREMTIAPMVGSGMTLTVQGDIKASGYKDMDGNNISTGGGGLTSAFSLSGTTLTMTTGGTGLSTFTLSGSTLTITPQ